MSACEVCGNEYKRAISVTQDGRTHTFDCFQCAIAAMAPECGNCEAKIIGHGVSSGGTIYCSQHCAHMDQPSPEPSEAMPRIQ